MTTMTAGGSRWTSKQHPRRRRATNPTRRRTWPDAAAAAAADADAPSGPRGGEARPATAAKKKSRESVVVEGTLSMSDEDFEKKFLKATKEKPENDAPKVVERGARGSGSGRGGGRGRGGRGRGGRGKNKGGKGGLEAVPEPPAVQAA